MDDAHLGESSWLLDDEEVLALELIGSTLRRGDGHVFMREGEASDFLLLIKKGHVKVTTGQPPRIVALRGPGETIGELGVIDDQPRSATVIAWGEVEALHVPANDLRTFLDQHRRAERALHAAVRKRLGQATRKISDSDLMMERRLAKAIIELYQNGLCEIIDDIPTIRLSQKDLASMTGASIEATKKIIRVFKEGGLVDTGRFQLRLTDAGALRKIADGNPTSSW
ncbi:Crp/Fnr family transcriptional regulator [Amycolatopsis japonica]|uniref:Crp/Fnr family transcriptional regulator n=1 Tax=Amycolatopsis japonica TaxID=208439 RepID=UPI0037B8DEC6